MNIDFFVNIRANGIIAQCAIILGLFVITHLCVLKKDIVEYCRILYQLLYQLLNQENRKFMKKRIYFN